MHGGTEQTPDAVIRHSPTDFALLAGTLDRQRVSWCVHGSLAAACYTRLMIFSPTLEIVLPFRDLAPVLADLDRQGFHTEAFRSSTAALRAAHPLRVRFDCLDRYQSFALRATVRPIHGEPVPVASLADVVQGLRWTQADPDRGMIPRAKASLVLLRLAGG